MSNRERIYTFDTIKIILILCVIFHHCTVPYFINDGINWTESKIFDTIYLLTMTFTMPLFMIISGYFFKPRPLYLCIRQYLFPCIIISGVLFIISTWSPAPFMSERPISNIGYAMWFIYLLFIYSAITPPLIQNKSSLNIVIILSFFISVIAGLSPIFNTTFQLSRLASYYFFYLLGYYLNQHNLMQFSNKKRIQRICIIGLFAIMILHGTLCQRHHLLLFTSAFDHGIGLSLPALLIRLYSISLTVVLSILVLLAIPNKKYFITKYGSRTLTPYLLHMIPIILISWGLAWEIRNTYMGFIINLLIVPSICMMFLNQKIHTTIRNLINLKIDIKLLIKGAKTM